MKVKIAPSLMCSDFRALEEEIRLFETKAVDFLHLDIMDGHFVPNLTMGPPVVQAVAAMTRLPLDIHMMVSSPDAFVPAMAAKAGSLISVHVEAAPDIERTLELIRRHGCRPAVALNPETAVEELDPILAEVDLVLVMCVHPGFAGQELVPGTIEKIGVLRQRLERERLSPMVEVDGNTSFENIRRMADAGADVVVAGTSCLYRKDRPLADALDELRDFVARL